MLKSTSCEMKTTTNHNERRPAAPRPAAEVLRYEVQPVTNWLSRTGRRESRCATLRRPAPPRASTLSRPSLSRTACLYYRRVYDTCVRAPCDYISLLDNTTGRCVGTIKTNVTLGDADWTALSFFLAHCHRNTRGDGDLH